MSGRGGFDKVLEGYCRERGLEVGLVEREVVEALEGYFREVFGCEVVVRVNPFEVWLDVGREFRRVGIEEIKRGVLKGALYVLRRSLRELSEGERVWRLCRVLRGRIGRLVRGVVVGVDVDGVLVEVDLGVFGGEVMIFEERLMGLCEWQDILRGDRRWLRERGEWGKWRYYMLKRVDVVGGGLRVKFSRNSKRFLMGLFKEFGYGGRVYDVRVFKGCRLFEVVVDRLIEKVCLDRVKEETGMVVRVVVRR